MVSALEALLAEERKSGITTNSKHFDMLFGEGGHGGIPIGAVTEICGMAGLGKVWVRALLLKASTHWYSSSVCFRLKLACSCAHL